MIHPATLVETMTSRSVGYARCSTEQKTTDALVAALKEAGCEVMFQESISTRTAEKDRAQLQAALSAVMKGDELVVTKLDRLGRTQREVINRLHDLQEEGIRSEPPTDSSTPKGWGSSRLSSSDCLLAWLKWQGSSSEREPLSPSHTAKQLEGTSVADQKPIRQRNGWSFGCVRRVVPTAQSESKQGLLLPPFVAS